jgi:hypothetical protein
LNFVKLFEEIDFNLAQIPHKRDRETEKASWSKEILQSANTAVQDDKSVRKPPELFSNPFSTL